MIPVKALMVAMILAGCSIFGVRAEGPRLTLETVNAADLAGQGPQRKAPGTKDIDPAVIKAQVLLDRAKFSPGVIDGLGGENTDKAIAAFAAAQTLPGEGKLGPEVWAKLTATSSEPVLVPYAITPDDVKGPFVKEIPHELEDMAKLDHLAYTSPLELLSEKFHMGQDLLTALNPGQAFDKPGTTIVVANVAASKGRSEKGRVARIEVDKAARVVRAFDGEGKLVAFYPASIGSEEKPAPSGTHKVTAVAVNPTYTYDPAFRFKGVKAEKKVQIPAGPNSPVGSVWIDLDVPTYGIHGTPEPEKVSKAYSHGCIRLTNWDVEDLARMVQKGTSVDFLEGR